MVCAVQIHEKAELDNPVLIEGLPGIGFVANISALHLIRELDAKLFAEITSSSFQDLAVTTEKGGTRSPINQLYYHKSHDSGRDLIIWYGNTQALTTFGQYELCGRVLDMAQELGCQYIITLGGFKTEQTTEKPQIYCAATDPQTLKTALNLDTKIMVGQIYGIAGITIGLAKLRNLKAFSLLIETTGTYPDQKAAKQALKALKKFLNLKINLTNINLAAEETKKTLQSFGVITRAKQEEKKEESPFRWFV